MEHSAIPHPLYIEFQHFDFKAAGVTCVQPRGAGRHSAHRVPVGGTCENTRLNGPALGYRRSLR
jgi:hypothetical protein